MNDRDIFKLFPIFDLGDVLLREISVKDTEDFFLYVNNPNVAKYLADDDLPGTISEAQEELLYWSRIFYRKHSIYWGIVDKNNNKLIGTCGFNHWNRHHNRVEVSYDLDYSYWGKGIMTRSLTEIFKFAHQDMYVNRIQATVAIDNFSSIKLLERLGLKKEGILKEYGILHDIKTDFYMYGSVK